MSVVWKGGSDDHVRLTEKLKLDKIKSTKNPVHYEAQI